MHAPVGAVPLGARVAAAARVRVAASLRLVLFESRLVQAPGGRRLVTDIREIRERYDPEALRYFLLTTHYRSPINFEVELRCPACGAELARSDLEARTCPACQVAMDEAQAGAAVRFPALEEAQRRLEYLYTTRRRLDQFMGQAATGGGVLVRADEVQALGPRFREAMDDDFNAAAALGVLSDLMRLSNEVLDNKDKQPEALVTSTVQVLQETLDEMAGALGILERDSAKALAGLRSRAVASASLDPAEIDRLIEERTRARKAKDFQRADAIRDQLQSMGVELMDGPGGTTWKVRG